MNPNKEKEPDPLLKISKIINLPFKKKFPKKAFQTYHTDLIVF